MLKRTVAAIICGMLVLNTAFSACAETEGKVTTIYINGQGSDEQSGPGAVPAAYAAIETQDMTDSVITVTDPYSYDQMSADIKTLKEKYGSLMQVNTYGSSADGRNLYEVVVGNPSASRHIMIQAAIHGREYITSLLVMKQIEYACAYHRSGTYQGVPVSELFSDTAIHFLPMTNPDGVSVSQYGENGLSSENLRQMLRNAYATDAAKTRTVLPYEDYLRYWKADGNGVDLNRNFPCLWDNVISTADSASFSGFRGYTPLSESETQSLAALADSRSWTVIVNYHSMGEVIYWDIEGNKARDASLFLATALAGMTGYRLEPSEGGAGYKDWLQVKDNPIPSVTLEVGNTESPVPVSQFPAIWAQNRLVWAYLLNYGKQ